MLSIPLPYSREYNIILSTAAFENIAQEPTPSQSMARKNRDNRSLDGSTSFPGIASGGVRREDSTSVCPRQIPLPQTV